MRSQAPAAALSVERKLTVLFPRKPRRSTVAPSTLSANVPSTAADVQTKKPREPNIPPNTQVPATAAAAAAPARVPVIETAPFVPAPTAFQEVTKRGTPPSAC